MSIPCGGWPAKRARPTLPRHWPSLPARLVQQRGEPSDPQPPTGDRPPAGPQPGLLTRTSNEIAEEGARLLALARASPAAEPTALPAHAHDLRFRAGAVAAMRWTLTETEVAPLRPDLGPVTPTNIGHVATLGQLLAKTDTAVAAYAAGVCAWLFWLTGDSPPISSFLS